MVARSVGPVLLLLWAAGCSRVQIRSPIAPAEGPPATFVRTTSDARTTRVIDVRDGLTKTAEFRAASDYLGQRFTVDVSDSRAGFLMTPWQTSPDLRYRTRIIVRFLGDDWKQVTVRSDANWQRTDEWDIGFDTKLLDEVSSELRARIGKRA